ncbi:hypothetical protein TELCIR_08807 [Teladorsagia circumcincta]|uniref:Protein kinase domain-containing protein n=1 Tax=Teladorsagia circumcincta TaxID=45464 RepID=A0A2G9UIQ9_TELCI|nr:hypothetical protein TELCIR_08807 [Teladorsagia circumcincta]
MKIARSADSLPERTAGTGLAALLPGARPDVVFFISKILVYRPRARLCGKEVLRDPFFDSLFREGAKRSNGQSISQCITSADIAEAHSIDESKVKAKLTSIVMRTKLDFSCDDESKESRELNAQQGQKVGASKVNFTTVDFPGYVTHYVPRAFFKIRV